MTTTTRESQRETDPVLGGAELELLSTPPEAASLGPALLVVDAVALTLAGLAVALLAWTTPAWILDVTSLLFVAWVVLLGLGLVVAGGLHQRRKCAIASLEITRIGRVTILGGIVATIGLQASESNSPYLTAGLLVVAVFLSLVFGRGAFRMWVKGQRQVGRYTTPVAVLGDRAAARSFARHMRSYPDSGFRPVAHVDITEDAAADDVIDITDGADDLPFVGTLSDSLEDLGRHGVRSAVLLADGLGPGELSRAVRRAEERFEHVQLVTNLVGVSHARLVPTPLVGEMTFYLEPQAPVWQRSVKRGIDVVVSALLLVLSAPLLAVIAAAVRTDGGPAMYTQERVGRDGRLITVAKFRSMVVDADERQDELADQNQRDGPLFKAGHDPRITRVGTFLRATSLDELPQLWSILVGDMSLVGPRPALPHEVADFDSRHKHRHQVRPGLTGLWQVEDRDHPDFGRYRRHDLFYVENWSLSLDFAILLQTVAVVLVRAVRALPGLGRDEVLV